MRAFLAGALIVVLAVWLMAARSSAWPQLSVDGAIRLFTLLVVLPLAVLWLVTEIAQACRPRRLFRGRRRARLGLCTLGAGTAILASGLTAGGAAFLDRVIPDALIVSTSFAVFGLVAFVILPRHRKGHCVVCGYDLRGGGGDSCPECGEGIDEAGACHAARHVMTCAVPV